MDNNTYEGGKLMLEHGNITSKLKQVMNNIREATDGKVSIHGQPYATVGLRVKCLRQVLGSLITIKSEMINVNEKSVTFKSYVYLNDIGFHEGQILLSEGYAHKSFEDVKPFLKPSIIEFCQTSSVGRALGFLGLIGDTEAIPSAEEMLLGGATIDANTITSNKQSGKKGKGGEDAFAN